MKTERRKLWRNGPHNEVLAEQWELYTGSDYINIETVEKDPRQVLSDTLWETHDEGSRALAIARILGVANAAVRVCRDLADDLPVSSLAILQEQAQEIMHIVAGGAWINCYRVSRQYGGPEEGGWYYDHRDPIASVMVFSLTKARAIIDMREANMAEAEGQPWPNIGNEDEDDLIYVAELHPGRETPKPHYS